MTKTKVERNTHLPGGQETPNSVMSTMKFVQPSLAILVDNVVEYFFNRSFWLC